jgi:hypothetical protein
MGGLEREAVTTIQRFLSQVYSFVLQADGFIRNQEILKVRLATHKAPGVDLRTRNRQRVNRWPPFYSRIIWGRTRHYFAPARWGLQWISDTLPAYDPLQFSLLFPHGERGWHLAFRYQGDATSHNNNRVSCLEFAVYRLYVKTNGCSMLLRAAKLLLIKCATLTIAMRASRLSGSPGGSTLVV